jgi:hypothetical protein
MTIGCISKNNLRLDKTKNILDASKTLKNMYESLSDTDPIKLYIKNNCLHLLDSLEITDILAIDNMTTDFDYYLVKSNEKRVILVNI